MQGLSSKEAVAKLQQHGYNELPEKRSRGPLTIFACQFQSPFIYVLFIAAVASFGLGQNLNGIFILAVLLINAAIGTIQEYSAQRAAAALKEMVPHNATVFRDGAVKTVKTSELVPCDTILLATGDKVPADIKLEQCWDLLINESMLTGESLAVAKNANVLAPEDAPLSERKNYAFGGTLVTHGRAHGTVIATGSGTEIGRIATEVSDNESIKPPLLKRIERFTLLVTYSVVTVIALLFLITVLRGQDLASVFLLGVALAVSAIPEGLPASITVALAIGMRRMAGVNVIVRKLVAVETLGSCTYIASDKTGTLTVNEMTIQKIVTADGQVYNVSGEGLDIHGEIKYEKAAEIISSTDATNFQPNSAQAKDDTNLSQEEHENSSLNDLILSGMLANEARLTYKDEKWNASGDGVDLAFLVLGAKNSYDLEQSSNHYPEIASVPYESENAFSASINRIAGSIQLHAKGSTEAILNMCSNTPASGVLNKERVLKQTEVLASQGYRVMAIAQRQLINENVQPKQELHNLTFLGLVAMIDPLRAEAKTAIEKCHTANIQVAMITGDHPQTALALSCQLGIATTEDTPVTGNQINIADKQGSDALNTLVKSTRVFARVEPAQKLKIVETLIQQGHFVAVTGDGVNDAPALHNAHVGIAMGKRGSDVARESSDLIITDDNFASIVDGIKQGRIVYNNIRKVIFLLISTGAAEITLFILSVVFSLPIPLFPIQLLWLNLVTNGIQDKALAFEPAEGDELQRAPRQPNEPIFNRLMLERVIINALVMGSIAFAVFAWLISQGSEVESARNITLLLMVLFENVHVLNSRSETLSIFKQSFFGNPLLLFSMLAAQSIHIASMYTPGLKTFLQVEPVTLQQWFTLLLLALILIVVDETHKYIAKRH